ncbi:MAG: L,D-transpeptidase family protein [Thermomicrobiales bacterium]
MGKEQFAGDFCRRRSICRLCWLIVAISVCLIGFPVAALADGIAVVSVPQLNLRSEPGLAAPVVGQVWQGEELALLTGPTDDDWFQVQSGDQTGWAFGGGLAIGGAVEAAEQGKLAASAEERWVDVDRTTQMVTLFEGENPVASFWAAMGSDASDDGFFATAVGTYYVYEKVGGLSWSDWGGAWIGDWVGFDSQRLNGFHTYSMDAAGDVLPHGDGPTGGCVALSPPAADQLFAFVSVGTRVEVHR